MTPRTQEENDEAWDESENQLLLEPKKQRELEEAEIFRIQAKESEKPNGSTAEGSALY